MKNFFTLFADWMGVAFDLNKRKQLLRSHAQIKSKIATLENSENQSYASETAGNQGDRHLGKVLVDIAQNCASHEGEQSDCNGVLCGRRPDDPESICPEFCGGVNQILSFIFHGGQNFIPCPAGCQA